MPFTSEIESIRLLYKEVIEGYSLDAASNHYIKHFNELEHMRILQYKVSAFNRYKKEIPSQDEKIKELIKIGEWSDQKEDDILSCKYRISDNEKNFKNVIPVQREFIRGKINQDKELLKTLLSEKAMVIGQTADHFAERESFNYMIYLSIYKDVGIKKFASYEEFQDIEDEEILMYGHIFEETISKFTQNALSRISVMPFFLNALSYSKDNVFNFLRVPIIEMTNFQSTLISLGLRHLNTLSMAKGEPPDLLDDVPIDEVVKWYDLNYGLSLAKPMPLN